VTSRQSFALSAVVADVYDTERLKAFAKIDVNDAGKFETEFLLRPEIRLAPIRLYNWRQLSETT
jgi:hypothetical protein